MIKLLLIISFFICSYNLQKLDAQHRIIIKGNIEGLKDSTLIAIVENPNAAVAIDSVYSKNGEFNFDKYPVSANIIYLFFRGYKPMFKLFSYNDEIFIKGNVQNIDKLEISGERYGADFNDYEKIISRYDSCDSLYNELGKKQKNEELIQKLNHILFLYDSICTDVTNFIKRRPDSPVSVFLLYDTYNTFSDKNSFYKVLNLLDGEAKNTHCYEEITQRLNDNEYSFSSRKELIEKIAELQKEHNKQ
jgi:hypothetical protein